MEIAIGLLLLLTAGLSLAGWEIRRKHMSRWLVPYLRDRGSRRAPAATEDVHVFLCFADHYEPRSQGATAAQGLARVQHWAEAYPRQFGGFRDSDGRPPRYTFFFPAEEYDPAYLDLLAELCRAGYGEVEIHLHHEGDTAERFRGAIEEFRDILVKRHGLLCRDRVSGAVRYAFIHGNWALCNSKPDGSCCGVDNELAILKETGCYVDMTFPSAPDATQPPIVNRIYYARDVPGRRASHETGFRVGERTPGEPDLMLIQGPLVLDWRRRKWGVLPRLENGCLQASQPPGMDRLDGWMRASIQVPGRPDWYFVKVHAHGASEDAHGVLLGEPMVRFHQQLARRARENPRFHYHYVTAREMYNLAKAAEAGFRGSVAEARDFILVPNQAPLHATGAERPGRVADSGTPRTSHGA